MIVKKYHLVFARITLILSLSDILLALFLNYPLLSWSIKYNSLIFLLLILLQKITAAVIIVIILSWLKRNFNKSLSTHLDYIKYGAIKGFLLPFTTLISASIATHLIAIICILISSSNPAFWIKIISWARYYLYLGPLKIFLPLMIIFTAVAALAAETHFKKLN